MDIPVWLRGLGLERYAEAFRDNAIDGDVLFDLTETDLERVGVLLGHRKKMLAAIAALRGDRNQGAPAISGPGPALAETEGERRQVTVLFADLVGFTALGNRFDPEEIHALLGRFFELVDRLVANHGGHVDKHIGDCVMAIFGAPTAHGNDTERAILAALAIRSAMPSLTISPDQILRAHMGIAAGEVVASGTGSEMHREYTVTGETVNFAARLTDEAQPDEILVSDLVWRALERRLDGADAGLLSVKGFAQPTRVYRLHGMRSQADEHPLPIAGRRKELQEFAAALSSCRDTGQGCALYIRGEAGIGKTRLIKEFERKAKAVGFASATGLVIDFGSGRDAVRTLIRSAMGIVPDATVEARGAAVDAAVENGLIEAEQAVFLNDLLDLAQPRALRGLYDAMNNAARQQGKRLLLTKIIIWLCRRQPQLLVVEDVHWADETTRNDLATLAGAAAECPAILVMTSRPERDLIDARWRGAAGSVPLTTIDLGPLRRDDALALARRLVVAGDRLAEQLVDRAGGNPLFLEQLLRHAQDNAQGLVPGSVQALVQARVDRLDPRSRRALQAASVLGQSFPQAALRHLIDDPTFDCADLMSHALLKLAGEEHLFAHALIREAVYTSLLRGRRKELHGAAAAWYATRDASLRAEHLDRADDAQAPTAYAEAAASQAGLLRYDRALQLVERGRMLAVSVDDRMRLGLLRAEILRELGRAHEALQAFREVALETPDGLAQCKAWIGVASCVRLLGGKDEGIAALEKAEPLAQRHQAQRELSEIHYYFGCLLFTAGDMDGCLRHHEDAHRFALRARDAECEARALSGLGDAHYGRGHMRLAIDHFRRCRALSRERGFGRVEVGSRHMTGAIRRYLFEWPAAVDDLRDAAAAAAKVGNVRTQMVALNILGEVLVDAGKPDEARDILTTALRLAETFDNPRYRAYVLYELGRAHYYDVARRGDALATLDAALATSRQTDMRFVGPRLLAVLALVSEQRRSAALAEGESIIKSGCLAHNALWFYRDAIEAHLKERDVDRARSCAAALADFTRSDPLPWSNFFIDRGRALADPAAGGRDRTLFETLHRLQREAEPAGLKVSLPEISAALADYPVGWAAS